MPPLDFFKDVLRTIARGEALSSMQAREAFGLLMSGVVPDAQIGAFLMGLRMRGETIEEIVAAAQMMREKMITVCAPVDAVDIVGTGGDDLGTYNISTCAAFIAAGAGLCVAKHGNRAVSSRSGAADTLEALGIFLGGTPEHLSASLKEIGICFLFAPNHHRAMAHVAPVRGQIGIRTVFNLLGPLCNPARVAYQVLGVYDRVWGAPLAHALGALGTKRAWVVCGEGGADEILSSGETEVWELHEGQVRAFSIAPEDVGVSRSSLEDLRGGNPEENAHALRCVLAGERGRFSAFADSACLTAGAALVVTGRVPTHREGVEISKKILENGRALTVLESLANFTHHPPPS